MEGISIISKDTELELTNQTLNYPLTHKGYELKDMSSDFGNEWFLKWAEGAILGFVRNRIELNRAKGMLKIPMNNISKEKFSLIFMNIEQNPIYLPFISIEEKVKRLKILRKN
jgi:hypothetical protein